MNDTDRSAVEQYFAAMRRKADGIEDLVALFGADAVYIEPFSGMGTPTTHNGHAAIAQFLRAMPDNSPPDMEVHVDRIDRQGGSVRAEWTCTSAAFAQSMRGFDVFDVRDGKIARLETTLTQGPSPNG